MRHNTSPKHQGGVSLIELMISITLGIVLILGTIQIYSSSKQTYRSQDALSRMQENARYAFEILTRDIRTTGYLGCGNLLNITPNIVGTHGITSYSTTTVITGNQNTGAQVWSPAKSANITSAVDDTDIITLLNAGRCSAPLTADMTDVGDPVTITNSCGIANNDIVMVTDCETSDIFQVSATPSGDLPHTDDLAKIYTTADGSEVLTLSSTSYFIRDNNDTPAIPALWALDNTRATGANNPVELIEGVENMQVQYGVDTNNDSTPEQYINANTVTNWSQVVTVRVTVLLRTIDNVNAADYVLNTGGTNQTYGGGFLRKEFVTTVQLRNRGLGI